MLLGEILKENSHGRSYTEAESVCELKGIGYVENQD